MMDSLDIVNKRDIAYSQRFESKYSISEVQAEAIKQYISTYVSPDPNAIGGHSYDISSLYLDSSKLTLYNKSLTGEKNRFKLRIRSYSDLETAPLYFEIKRRIDGIVKKQRAGVRREVLGDFLRGKQVTPEFLTSDNSKQLENLRQFRDYVDLLQASPRLLVRYLREAYLSTMGDAVRITFDRQLSCLPNLGKEPQVRINGAGWFMFNVYPVILEIKFTDVFPFWVQKMVHDFHLIRISIAKYVTCINQLEQKGILLDGMQGLNHSWI